jgi:tetratricopeptide (TPR) repeat protein
MVLESRLLRERGDWYELSGPLPPLAIPSTLHDSLMARLDRLGSVREVAQLAATIGRDFSYDVLHAICPLDDSALRDAMAALVDAEVVYQRGVMPQARYFFKHALICDAAYESLLKSRRQQIHSRVARVLEEEFPERVEPQPELIAHHYTQAGLAAQAIPYWLRAGEQALQRAAFSEAINDFTGALSLLSESPSHLDAEQGQRGHGELHCALLLELAEAQRRSGQPRKAQQTLMRAVDLAQSLGSANLIAQAAWHLGTLRVQVGLPIPKTTIRLFEETLSRTERDDSPLRAAVLAGLAMILASSGASNEALEYGEQGVEMARRLGDLGLVAMTLNAICAALQSPERAKLRLIRANEMVETAQGAMVSWALAWRLTSLFELGDILTAKQDIEELAQQAQELREPFLLCLLKNYQFCEALTEGRFSDGERLAQDALGIGQTLEIDNAAGVFGVQMFTLRREQGRLREVEPILRYFIQGPESARAWRPGLALLYSELGDAEKARAEFLHLAKLDFADIPRDANWLLCLSYLADICTFLEDSAHALTLYKLLLPYREINLVAQLRACYGSVSRYLGALAAVMARWDEAERHFEGALVMNSAMGARRWLAHTQYQYARMLLARDQAGDSDKAATLLKDALATARELGMRALEERITSGSP